MDLVRGQVVKSIAGRDAGTFAVVLEDDGTFASLCDGARRTLQSPKKKKHLHLRKTLTVLEEEELQSDRAIKKALRRFCGQE